MSFHWPDLLWLLLVPAALLAGEFTRRRRAVATSHPKILRAEAGTSSLELVAARAEIENQESRVANPSARPRYWLAAGLALAILALARPQWGRIEEPVFDQSREILLALDLSRSMLAPDVKPTRLDRAKLLVTSLLEKLSGERVGLVVFAGTAFLQSPLSADYEIMREFLPALNPDFLPQGGSNYTALLRAAAGAFSATESADRFLVVLSDGEATDDGWRESLDELKKKNVRTIGLGVGTAAGAMIPDGTGGFVKDERGAVVMSKLETATLEELARATGGVYRDASAWVDLAALVKETVEAGRKGQFLETNTVRLVERFQIPLWLAVWCLLISLCYEFPVRPRPRAIALRSNAKFQMPNAKLPSAAALLLALLCHVPLKKALQKSVTQWVTLPMRIQAPTGFRLNTVILGACLSLGVLHSARGAEAAPPPPPSAGLSRIIGRVSTKPTPTARDWAELARETVTWGSRLQSERQPVPEDPVRDALSAVGLGGKLDAQTADWSKLRQELEALLEKKDEDKEKKDQQQQDKDQQNQDKDEQQKQQQNQDQEQQPQQDQQKKGDGNNSNVNQGEDKDKKQSEAGDPKKDGESAFGDMKKQEEPPAEPAAPPETQKVGGNQDQKQQAAEPVDPSLAVPLQKLEQVRNQDSPARLFQLLEGEKKPDQKKPGKDW